MRDLLNETLLTIAGVSILTTEPSWTYGRPLKILTDFDCETESPAHNLSFDDVDITGTPAKGSIVS